MKKKKLLAAFIYDYSSGIRKMRIVSRFNLSQEFWTVINKQVRCCRKLESDSFWKFWKYQIKIENQNFAQRRKIWLKFNFDKESKTFLIYVSIEIFLILPTWRYSDFRSQRIKILFSSYRISISIGLFCFWWSVNRMKISKKKKKRLRDVLKI